MDRPINMSMVYLLFLCCKPYPFCNEYHTPIAENLTTILFQTEIVQDEDAQNVPVIFDDSRNTGGLLISLTRGI